MGIHVRKGADYQSRIWYQNTCSVDYYLHAVEMMKKQLKNPRFYVFADNKEWVRENLKGFDYTLVDGNPGSGWGSHYDLQLMSYCKHNIISNSTYSWWGAFLNQNRNKVVIMPKVWFNPVSCEEHTSERLQCTKWIQLYYVEHFRHYPHLWGGAFHRPLCRESDVPDLEGRRGVHLRG